MVRAGATLVLEGTVLNTGAIRVLGGSIEVDGSVTGAGLLAVGQGGSAAGNGEVFHGAGGSMFGTGNLNQAFADNGTQLAFTGNQNQLIGMSTGDWLGVSGTNNALVGGAGDEVWIGASGHSNTLDGGDGSDTLFAGGNSNSLHGGNGTDWLGASGSSNVLYGGTGNEWMGASGNGNYLLGGEGGDTLLSVGGNFVYGESGDDWVGCSGNGNFLNGAQGNDYLAASGNSNTLDGGAGNDQLVAGGAHAGDRFVFHVGYGMDTVTNFSRHRRRDRRHRPQRLRAQLQLAAGLHRRRPQLHDRARCGDDVDPQRHQQGAAAGGRFHLLIWQASAPAVPGNRSMNALYRGAQRATP